MKRSTLLIFAFVASFVASGIIETVATPQAVQSIGFAHGILIGVIAYLWVKADANDRSTIPPGRSAILSGILPIVGIPAYFFRTRNWRQALGGSVRAVALLIAGIFCSALATEATKHLL
jgi:protein-S-isoprenylcysteine O-methyltransferase Ste14